MTFRSVPPVAAALALLLAGPALAKSAAPAQQAQGAPAGQEQLDPQKAFLVENAKKKGVKTTPSGLQFRILKDGEFGAKSPKSTDAVLVHYEGRLIDGTIFDSSYERGEPISFPLSRVIAGWTEGVGMMRVGETRELVIPSELAYGARGAPPNVPPHATLVFKVELLEIVDPAAMPPR
jgi:FKBP-type peptidyl-prolyl cis-trans isomerase